MSYADAHRYCLGTNYKYLSVNALKCYSGFQLGVLYPNENCYITVFTLR